jgi:hypothetical protein
MLIKIGEIMKTKFILFTMFFSLCAFSTIDAVVAVCTCNNKDSKGNNITRTSSDLHLGEDPKGTCTQECKKYGGLKTASVKN